MGPRKYDFLVVGAGLFGATFARHLTDCGKRVLVVDRRQHIAGNCYDEEIEGIHVGKYGPHFFHCPDAGTWRFVNRFTEFNDVRASPKAVARGGVWSMPINLMTMHQLWGVATPEEARRKIEEVRVPIERPSNFREQVLSTVGQEIYELLFEGYTRKQWGRDPSELPASIAKRIPIRFNYDDNYFPDSHIHQGIPKRGYTKMFEAMLEDSEVRLGVDFIQERRNLARLARHVLYTGPLDELYRGRFGKLEYRSLRFETERLDGDFQGNTVMNYTDESVPWTRITEWKHKYRLDVPHTYITREYPASYAETGEAYYPIADDSNRERHEHYRRLAVADRLLTGGRNADYRYYDMNMVIPAATRLAEEVLGKHKGQLGV